jgi:hypothetical protein
VVVLEDPPHIGRGGLLEGLLDILPCRQQSSSNLQQAPSCSTRTGCHGVVSERGADSLRAAGGAATLDSRAASRGNSRWASAARCGTRHLDRPPFSGACPGRPKRAGQTNPELSHVGLRARLGLRCHKDLGRRRWRTCATSTGSPFSGACPGRPKRAGQTNPELSHVGLRGRLLVNVFLDRRRPRRGEVRPAPTPPPAA